MSCVGQRNVGESELKAMSRLSVMLHFPLSLLRRVSQDNEFNRHHMALTTYERQSKDSPIFLFEAEIEFQIN